MSISEIKIFIPVKLSHTITSMYLPIFLAKQQKIFEEILTPIKVNICEPLTQNEGDKEAIDAMLNQQNATTLTLAIADPNAIQPNEERNHKNVRVLGALINKLSFWAISKTDKDIQKYSTLAYYDTNLITGYKVGTSIINKHSKESSFRSQKNSSTGKEFQYLDDNDSLVITPDLLQIAKEHTTTYYNTLNQEKFIRIHFAKDNDYFKNDYVTTAILTSVTQIDSRENKELIIKVIDSIQKAKSIVYSSKKIAQELLEGMRCMDSYKKTLTNDQIKQISNFVIDRIQDEQIYACDANINSKLWKNTVEVSKKPFRKYVNNYLILAAEGNIANTLGITFKTLLYKRWWGRMLIAIGDFFIRYRKGLIYTTGILILVYFIVPEIRKWAENLLKIELPVAILVEVIKRLFFNKRND